MQTSQERVVVGVDGSADSERAIDWAFTEAVRNHAGVHLVHAVPVLADRPGKPDVPEALREQGEQVLLEAASRAPADLGADVTREIFEGPAAAALVAASENARLVVVGSRGHGALAGLMIGSVSQHTARHAHCPVVVVRAPADARSGRVVVGVDDSDASLRALEFAFDFAAAHQRPLTAVRAWSDVVVGGGPGVGIPASSDASDRRRGELGLLHAALAEYTSQYPQVDVTATAEHGHPARVLSDASEHAAAVVVGARGRGAFAGMLLGSTSQAVMHHASCPVIVAR
jgi:nucleotide-binding universal stress UspA family protein